MKGSQVAHWESSRKENADKQETDAERCETGEEGKGENETDGKDAEEQSPEGNETASHVPGDIGKGIQDNNKQELRPSKI
ncbi:hypothetical protein NDU88_007940 [Pleurodeles waltl]|uniref:Uncharacterized protein n=1 Tax=Pleurodeles waltl TaxID=8319 RepID=A0AAV7QM30_PLEWA|nr:hypothetical protein NDU88_007940 [Pleurodeles waltl]